MPAYRRLHRIRVRSAATKSRVERPQPGIHIDPRGGRRHPPKWPSPHAQCGEGERWAGLWDFPRFALEAEGPLFAQREIAAKVREQTGITCAPGPLVHTIKHGVTRYRITLDCYVADYTSGKVREPARWIKAAKLADLPLSTTGRKIAGLIRRRKYFTAE